MSRVVVPASSLRGDLQIPPDKSVAHRTVMLSAIAEGTSHIANYPRSADPRTTLACIEALGIDVEENEDILTVHGRGLHGLQAPSGPLDCENSGTTMRLLAGILSGQEFGSSLIGDASLMKRPMERIASPLRRMGAKVSLNNGHPPIDITGGQRLRPLNYEMPVASAQVKSCVLLAGLYADGVTTVIESLPSRDHTERMLGLSTIDDGESVKISVEGGMTIAPRTWAVPGDFSGAAFFMVAGLIVPDSELHLRGVGLNPSRSALLDVLRAVGCDIGTNNQREVGGEILGDLHVRTSELHGVTVGGRIVPNLIDEIPALSVAAAYAHGTTEIRDAAELRVKESDRIRLIVDNLAAMGADVSEREDGLVIHGGSQLRGGRVDSQGDHRIAMAMGVAALAAKGDTTVIDPDCAAISYPGFWDAIDSVRR